RTALGQDMADSFGNVGDVRPRAGGDAEEVGDLDGQLAWRTLGRSRDVDDRDALLVGETEPSADLVGLAEHLDRGRLPRRPRTGDDEAAARADLSLVEQREEPALVDDLLHGGGVYDDELGVVRHPLLVVSGPLLFGESGESLVREKIGLVWPGVDEAAPAGERGRGRSPSVDQIELEVAVTIDVVRRHHHRWAS